MTLEPSGSKQPGAGLRHASGGLTEISRLLNSNTPFGNANRDKRWMLDANAAFWSGSTNETGLPVAPIGKPTTEPDPAALFVQWTISVKER